MAGLCLVGFFTLAGLVIMLVMAFSTKDKTE